MKVKIKKLSEDAVVPFKTYGKDFCYDVVATSEEEIAPNVWKYGLGLAFQIDRELYKGIFNPLMTRYDITNLSIDLRPRSSIWKTGMSLSNSIGTIDELFTGEASAVFYHLMTNMPRYREGDKIGQIKIGITFPMEFEQVEWFLSTERGDRGYGSTDLK